MSSLLFALLVAGAPPGPAVTRDCLSCHPKVAEAIRQPGAHAPAAKGECTTCHGPHATKLGRLLREEPRELCRSCHAKVVQQLEQPVVHAPARQGCDACHAPHGPPSPAAGGGCSTCHAEQELFRGEVRHAPAAQGKCLTCHAPHAAREPGLLRPGPLCTTCHPVASLAGTHLGQTITDRSCRSCHDPHAGATQALLRPEAHAPFAKGDCEACHGRGDLRAPSLCLTCHEQLVSAGQLPRSHLANERGNCLRCHEPHASQEKKLVRARLADVCLDCHRDTKARLATDDVRHPKIDRCQDCHQPHGSPDRLLLRAGPSDTCMGCHGIHAEFAHPMGDQAVDPRSKRELNCGSCHAAMGSAFPYHLWADKDRDLCVMCH